MKDEHQHDVDEIAIRKLILEEWSRKRIIKFCTHLMGDKCQECASKNADEARENNTGSHAIALLQQAYDKCKKDGIDLDSVTCSYITGAMYSVAQQQAGA